MPTRLKSIELNGYKTFATSSCFEFADAITAIVGPNGSGKSNIADALRWVLGEQSYSLLRGRKTVDMIFSGSEHRPRAGMASATILFDNSTNWLPIDFAEVSITRRAYRDGTNEYLINGQRVRLRDVSELLAQSGLAERTYTIIGQGLVDTALSLKADERRRLFEEAAGIGLYRSRRDEALRRLESTLRNLERVEDILTELRPRLRSLERQARRAREYDQIKSDLHDLLLEWYGYHWHHTQHNLVAAQKTARERAGEAQAARDRMGYLDQRLSELRKSIHGLRARLADWNRELGSLHDRRETVARDLAVAEARRRALSEREQAHHRDLERLEEEIEFLTDRHGEAEAEVASRQEEWEAAQEEATRARTELDAQREARADAQKASLENQERLEALHANLAEVRARRQEVSTGRERQVERLEALSGRLAQSERALRRAEMAAQDGLADLNEARAARREVERQEEELQTALDAARQRLDAIGRDRAELAEEISRLSARQEVLDQAEQAFAGYRGGARLLLEAARQNRIGGVQGALRHGLQVPPAYERAVAAVLGEFLDAILMAGDREADRALDYLGEQEARAVLLSLRDLTPPDRLPMPGDGDVIGVAADLVEAPAALRPAVELLLGRVWVVRDRAAAKRLVAGRPGGLQVVTLSGEVFHADGVIHTGADAEAHALGRPARRRAVRSDLAARKSERQASEAEEQRIRDGVEALVERLRRQEEMASQARQREREREEVHREAQAELTRQNREKSWLEEQLEQNQRALREADETMQALQSEERDLLAAIEASRQDRRTQFAEQAALTVEEVQERAAHADLRAAVAERALAEAGGRRDDHDRALTRARQRRDDLDARMQSVSSEFEHLTEHESQLRSEETAIAGEIESLEREVRPAERDLAEAENQHDDFLSEEIAARQALTQAERNHSQAQIALARQQEALATLTHRIEDDFGLVEFEYEEEVTGATPLPLEGMVEQLPRVETPSPEVEADLRRKRNQLRRMGAINPEARREYREVRERFEFLTGQIDDLKQAEADIRQVILELESLMEREFAHTYEAVADEFQEIFKRLFGGGSARLSLTDPDDLTETGIDIEARLPGRREQGLSLLSGGERSLTATALIFALLKVSPTPFCVLDEVDAMLDEANVGRFRELLRELSRETQFILITHNRATVQVADVIYGITMGRDSTSQVLSLKLDDVEAVYAA